jgi:4-amino-4-deoxy-L-arabinose transferase-like glycosyltransferase
MGIIKHARHFTKRGLAAALDYASASHARGVALLLIFALVAFLPGFFQIPSVDRDEARFAQASKQMLESGDYVDIRFQDEARYKKPVGIYWLQAAAVTTGAALRIQNAPTTIWLYRLPSLLGAIGAVLLTYWAALAFVMRRAALIAALMMASSILLGVEARLAKTDAVLLFASVAAMGAMARIYLNVRRAPRTMIGWQMPLLLWTAMAVGVLIKGPLILMFASLTAISLSIADRNITWLKALRPLAGFVWLIALVTPWLVAIVMKSGDSFFVQAVGHDMFNKVVSSQEAHGAPPGYYLALFWVTFWPGSVLTGLATPFVWRARKEPVTRFLLAWLVPSWFVFEIVMTKLPHYVLPLYPAIAILIAGVVDERGLAKTRWMVHGTAGWLVFPSVIAIAVLTAFIMVDRDLSLITWPIVAAAVIFGLLAWWFYRVEEAESSLLHAFIASVFVATTVYGLVFPSLRPLFPSQMIADEVHSIGCKEPRAVSTLGYQEPSLVFLLGTETRFTDGANAAEFLRGGACRFAVIDAHSEGAFMASANVIGLHYTLMQRIYGFNISAGKRATLALFRSVE